MATNNSDDIGVLVPVQIPKYSENADIQEALRLYHYGPDFSPSESDESKLTDPLSPNHESIAGYIASMQAQLDSISANDVTALVGNENLNTKIENGYYHQDNVTDASSGSNYQAASPGILFVVASEDFVYQTYHTSGDSTLENVMFMRIRDADSNWSAWKEISTLGHNHDDRYTTTTGLTSLLSSKQNTLTGAATSIASTNLTADRLLVSNGTGKVSALLDVSAEEAGYLSGVTSSIQDQINTKVDGSHGASHAAGGTDPVQIAQSQVTNLSTTLATKLAIDASNIGTSAQLARQNLGIFTKDGANQGSKIFVQSSAPTTANVGDLWFW